MSDTDTGIAYRLDPFPSEKELAPLWRAAWGDAWSGDLALILTRSFPARHHGRPRVQRRGIATELVRQVAEAARDRGAHWLHVDYQPPLDGFYKACGFRPTAAGLIRL